MCNNPILYDILQFEIILTDTRYYYIMADAKKNYLTNIGQFRSTTKIYIH